MDEVSGDVPNGTEVVPDVTEEASELQLSGECLPRAAAPWTSLAPAVGTLCGAMGMYDSGMSSQKLLDRVCVPERVPADPGPLTLPVPVEK